MLLGLRHMLILREVTTHTHIPREVSAAGDPSTFRCWRPDLPRLNGSQSVGTRIAFPG
jgi:hypothetical protein